MEYELFCDNSSMFLAVNKLECLWIDGILDSNYWATVSKSESNYTAILKCSPPDTNVVL